MKLLELLVRGLVCLAAGICVAYGAALYIGFVARLAYEGARVGWRLFP